MARTFYFVQPEPIQGTRGEGLIGLEWFLGWLASNDVRFARSGLGLRARVELEKLVRESPGKVAPFIALSEPAAALAQQAAENPMGAGGPLTYPGKPETLWLRFVDALAKPRTTPPSVVDTNAEGITRSSEKAPENAAATAEPPTEGITRSSSSARKNAAKRARRERR